MPLGTINSLLQEIQYHGGIWMVTMIFFLDFFPIFLRIELWYVSNKENFIECVIKCQRISTVSLVQLQDRNLIASQG